MTSINHYIRKATGTALARAIGRYFRGGDAPVTIGMEMERFILRRDGSLPSAAEHDVLYKALHEALGDKVSVEPGAHMIEIKTGIHTDGAAMSTELLSHLDTVKRLAESQGLAVAATSDLPGFNAQRLAENLLAPRDPVTGKLRRAFELVASYHRHGWESLCVYGTSTTSIQFTHAVTDADKLHRWARVHAAMMPLYYTVFENRTRTQNGVHTGLAFRRAIADRGLVPDYIFAAKDGADFTKRYIDFVMNSKMPVMQDKTGQDERLEEPQTFNELPKRRQTLGNLLEAASFSWNICKIKAVIDEDALANRRLALSNLLLEVRDMDVSDGAVPAIAGWFGTLVKSDEMLDMAENLLEELGVPVKSNPKRAGAYTNDALRAVEKNPAYLDTPFGNPKNGHTLHNALTGFVLPLLAAGNASEDTVKLWQEMARAHKPVFRAAAPLPR